MGLLDKLLPEYREKCSRLNNLIIQLRYCQQECNKADMAKQTSEKEIAALKTELDAMHQTMTDPNK